ncbi:hypothetical protein [Oceanospirillum sediminis]|uniref:Uncharacterized protein n=1 Tax=Oceanospirillum sediminis TaxID=2760088 RepID=A0A839IKF0_9GAMM|nr:hypothetical protein [Oceanospirillum sediminis]MBB1485190.1 hypothetical protein [Oceanospirillum sediminis]
MIRTVIFLAGITFSAIEVYASAFDDEVIRQRAKLSQGEANEYISQKYGHEDTRRMTNQSRDGETEHYGEFEFDSPGQGRDNIVIKIDVDSDIASKGDCISVGSVDVDGVSIRKLTLDVEFEEINHYNRGACIEIGNIKGAQYINEVDVIINGDKVRAR